MDRTKFWQKRKETIFMYLYTSKCVCECIYKHIININHVLYMYFNLLPCRPFVVAEIVVYTMELWF